MPAIQSKEQLYYMKISRNFSKNKFVILYGLCYLRLILSYLYERKVFNMKKKILVAVALFGILVLPHQHIHDEKCGYDPITKKGCIYEIQTCSNGKFGN